MTTNFISPRDIEELCNALKIKDNSTFIISGGTDLTIKLVKDQIYDFNIIDISKFDEFRKIQIEGDVIKIGSCITMTQLENSNEIKELVPALSMAASNVGSTQIRNRATIGGNVANAAQCGDTIPVLFAYDAKLKILTSSNDYRYEYISDFVLGINKTTLKENEIIASIEIKRTNEVSSFSKIGSRKTVTISKLNCCGKFQIDENHIITAANIYMGAVGVKPIRANLIEKSLIGRSVLEDLNEDMKNSIEEQIENAIPDRSSRFYKRTAGIGLIEDMLNNLGR